MYVLPTSIVLLHRIMASQNAISAHQCSKIWNPCSSCSGSHWVHSVRMCTFIHSSGMVFLVLHIHELCCQFLYWLVLTSTSSSIIGLHMTRVTHSKLTHQIDISCSVNQHYVKIMIHYT